jgi:hypothetical protein
MIRQGETRRVLKVEKLPIIGPRGWDRLERREARARPLEDERIGVLRVRGAFNRHALCEREKAPTIEREISPLFGGEARKFVERDEPIAKPFVNHGSRAQIIRAAPRSDAGNREKDAGSDLKKFCVFGTVRRQPLEFDEAAVSPFVNNSVDLAVAAVHIWALPWQV